MICSSWHVAGVEIIFFVWPVIFAAEVIKLQFTYCNKGFCWCSTFPKHLSLEAFPISAVRKCLVCRKSTFSHLFYSIFFFENTVMHCLLEISTLEIQTRLRLTLSQSRHFKRLLNAIAHKHSIKYNPFIHILYIKSKIRTCS